MKSREETWRGDAEVAAVRTGKDSKRTTARVAAQGWTGNGRALFGGSGLGEGSGVKSYQQGRGRNAKKAERKVGKGKGKETIPGSCKNPLSPRGRAREGLASFASGRPDGLPTARYARNSRYHEAGAAADEIIETCFGTDDDRNLWAYYCYHHDIETILEKARELKSRFRQGELKNPVTAFQRWLTRTYGCEGEGSKVKVKKGDLKMNYRNTRLAKGFLSLDTIAAGRDMSKFRPLSDRGAGVERIVRMIDCSDCSIAGKPRWRVEGREAAKERTRRIDAARQKLRRMGLGYLVPTLMLICKNGRWRDESIREIAARRHLSCHAAEVRYFGHREKILKAFGVQ